jgi:hypothetical protein
MQRIPALPASSPYPRAAIFILSVRRYPTCSGEIFHSFKWRTTAWASYRRSRDAPLAYARRADGCMSSANLSEAV